MDRIKILLADPDTRFTELASLFLSKSNDFDTITCKSDGNDALKHIRSLHPDTVLFDLALPGLDGISLLRKVNILPNPPVMPGRLQKKNSFLPCRKITIRPPS